MKYDELTIAVVGERALEVAHSLRAELPGILILAPTGEQDARLAVSRADALITYGHELPDRLLDGADRLRWVQVLTSGTDHMKWLFVERPDVLVTSAKGAHTAPVAEFALLSMLALARDLRGILHQQVEKRWGRTHAHLLYNQVVGIAGLGEIGTAIAQRCRAFGIRTVGFGSTPRTTPDVDSFHTYDQLADVAPDLDFLVIAAALNETTRGLVDRRVLAALKPSAFLVNVARGDIVDEAALTEALQAGRLAGAALDVFVTEPLPFDSPLWTLPKVIVSPHTAGSHAGVVQATVPLVVANTRHLLAGQPENMRTLVQWPTGNDLPVPGSSSR
jgi:phosphoglycerate dehydrogenase-like enzyme